MHYRGEGVDQNYEQVKYCLEKVCTEDNPEKAELYTMICGQLGAMYYKGQDIAQDYEKAVKYFSMACEAGNSDACSMAGTMYHGGDEIKQDKAKYYFEKICTRDNLKQDKASPNNCGALGQIYEMGDGAAQDFKKAIEYYDMACEAGSNEACSSLGVMYLTGHGVKENTKTALKYFKQGCDAGEFIACAALGSHNYDAKNYDAARRYYGKACELSKNDDKKKVKNAAAIVLLACMRSVMPDGE